jgi:ABC-type uncharacterized transport system involved in gliding motility auxiliary subunit
VVFIDPNAETDSGASSNPMMMMQGPPSRISNPKVLLASWGLMMPEGDVVGDLSVAVRVRAQQEGRLVTIDYPMWMNLGEGSLSTEDIVTNNLGTMTFASSGHLELVEGSGLTITPLIRTSENAMIFPVERVQNFADPQGLLKDYAPAGENFVLAARVVGTAKSAFPDGPPPPPKAKEGEAPPPPPQAEHLAQSKGNINVVVVADVDMLADQFWVQVQNMMGSRIAVPTASNGPMVLNALDNLTGSGALIDIRSRGGFLKPFTVVEDLRRAAEVKFREKEEQLIARLEQAEASLRDLETAKQGDDAPILSDQQRQELIDFRKERLQIRKDLREVRRSLRSDIEQLESNVKFANVGLMPILIALGGLIVAAMRLARRRRSLLAAGALH